MLLDAGQEPGEEAADDAEGDESPPSSTLLIPPVPLEPRGDRQEPLVFRQGAHPPYGIRWYGITSLFGHLRNFVARAIATESVDTRDWMRPNSPDGLLTSTVRILAPGTPAKGGTTSLTEVLGRAIWLDFVADTGDDRDVSAAVGAMLAATYDVEGPDGGRLLLPRGDLLVFGGDVSYPVATADEIYKRLVLPWNEQLRKVGASSKKRVVLGVPGNHDWYDGLDGFGRLFRRRFDEPFKADDRDPTSRIGKAMRKRPGRKAGLVARQLHLDEVGGLYRIVINVFKSLRAFFSGTPIKRRRRLVLRGYETVQEASYFVLPLTAGLELWGADRQLGRVDFRQRAFFTRRRKQSAGKGVLFAAGDPAIAYGVRNDPGARMLQACGLRLERDRVLYLAGDFHHYERRKVNRSMHVVAGGGGAFLHGTRIAPYPEKSGPPLVAYPSAQASRELALQVPLRLMFGRGGFVVHLCLGLLASIELGAASKGMASMLVTASIISVGLAVILYFVGHQGEAKKRIALVAAPFAAALGFLPVGLYAALPAARGFGVTLASDSAVTITSAFVGALIFGFYLMLLAVLGLEHQQAFTVLGHPGFKHFMRLCIHPDGKVDAWTIGKDDVLVAGAPCLIDEFSWDPKEP